MNKTEYLNALKMRLRRLPKEDYQTALEYFEEYFNETGAENEAQAIEDLGTPEFAAEQIIATMAMNNTREPVRDVKKGLNAVWVGILAVCAAPIALPLVCAFAIVIMAFIFCILLMIACFLLLGVVLALMGPVCLVAGFTLIASNLPALITCIGMGFLSCGIGLLITFGMIRACKWFLTRMIRFFGHIVKKGGKSNEQSK